jgi:hypothetical protein
MKKISILVIAKGETASVLRLVRTAMKAAANRHDVQVVIAASKDNRCTWDAIHKLYSEFPVELFDEVKQPTVKAVSYDYTRPSEEAYEKMEAKADGYIIVRLEDFFYFNDVDMNWDRKLHKLFEHSTASEGEMMLTKGRIKASYRPNYNKLKIA